MSKFDISLSMKNIKILKHSLEKRIASDSNEYDTFRQLGFNHELSDEAKVFMKDHEEHIKCLNVLIEEIKRTGSRHGLNVFGSKYN